jgi:hypothetical protein
MSERGLKWNSRWPLALLLAATIVANACAGTPAAPTAIPTVTPAATFGLPLVPIQEITATPSAVPTVTDTASPAPSATTAPSPTPAPSATPAATTAPDPVLLAAGDIASCLSTGDEATAALISAITGTVATLGDNVYERGSGTEFKNCFDPSWGPFKDRIHPAPGNHEYDTPGAQGYFNYFGSAAGQIGQGYYSYDLGAWHVIVLNSQCWDVGGCGASAPQSQWLKADLAAHSAACTLAYWHTPRFSSGAHGDQPLIQAFWDLLYAGGADVVLNGHDHDYERFAPQDPQGKADPANGIREFVVGTGGRSHYPFLLGPHANTEARNDATYGVLKLTLHPAGYDFEFRPVAGQPFTDSGSGVCH